LGQEILRVQNVTAGYLIFSALFSNHNGSIIYSLTTKGVVDEKRINKFVTQGNLGAMLGLLFYLGL